MTSVWTELDLTAARSTSDTAVKLMAAISDTSGVFHAICQGPEQADIVDRIASRAQQRGLTSATVITEVR